MKLKKIAIAFCALAYANVYAVETYNTELGIGNLNSSTDAGTDTTMTYIGASYYFKPINIDGTQPFMEMDVLQKASNIGIRYANMSVETSALSKTMLNPLQLSGTFYIDDFLFGLNNSTWNKSFTIKSNTAYNYEIKSTTSGFNLGYWILPSTTISYVYSKASAQYTRNSTSLSAINDLNTTTNGIASHTISKLDGNQSLVLDLGYSQIKTEQTKTENNIEYDAKVRYYPESKYYIEGGFIVNTGDNESDKGKTYVFGVGYAFTPRMGVFLSTEKFNGDVSSENSSGKSTTITAGYRF